MKKFLNLHFYPWFFLNLKLKLAERVNNEKWPHHNSPFKSTIAIRKPKSFQSLCHWNSNCRIYPPLVRSRATLRALYTWPRNAHLEHHEPLNVRLHKLAPAMGHLPRLRNCPSFFINMIYVKFWAALFFFVRRIGSSVSSSTSVWHTTTTADPFSSGAVAF